MIHKDQLLKNQNFYVNKDITKKNFKKHKKKFLKDTYQNIKELKIKKKIFLFRIVLFKIILFIIDYLLN